MTGPADNEIWYTTTNNDIYDLGGIISMLSLVGATYNGPAVVSNELDAEKQMYVMKFDSDVTVLGDVNLNTMIVDGPFFITEKSFQLECNVETIVLPNSVTRIGDLTFRSCAGLTSITIPESVTSIGESAFEGCSSLTSPVYNAHCFAYMPTSYSGAYTIPEGIKQIAGGAFRYCSSLTSITIPNSVTSIGSEAFYNCSSLTSITIPNSVTSIRDWTFDGCHSLTYITFQGTIEQWNAISKGYNWKDGVPATHVQCSDGQVTL